MLEWTDLGDPHLEEAPRDIPLERRDRLDALLEERGNQTDADRDQ